MSLCSCLSCANEKSTYLWNVIDLLNKGRLKPTVFPLKIQMQWCKSLSYPSSPLLAALVNDETDNKQEKCLMALWTFFSVQLWNRLLTLGEIKAFWWAKAPQSYYTISGDLISKITQKDCITVCENIGPNCHRYKYQYVCQTTIFWKRAVH